MLRARKKESASGQVSKARKEEIICEWHSQADYGEIVGRVAKHKETTDDLVIASCVRYGISRKTPLSQLLQYSVDIAGDQFIAEEFYQKYPDLLEWLAVSGCDSEEVQIRAYIQRNPQIFVCRIPGCDGKIVGGCPRMYCERCGASYMLYLEGLTDKMCERCVANELGECTENERKILTGIYGIMEDDCGLQC